MTPPHKTSENILGYLIDYLITEYLQIGVDFYGKTLVLKAMFRPTDNPSGLFLCELQSVFMQNIEHQTTIHEYDPVIEEKLLSFIEESKRLFHFDTEIYTLCNSQTNKAFYFNRGRVFEIDLIIHFKLTPIKALKYIEEGRWK